MCGKSKKTTTTNSTTNTTMQEKLPDWYKTEGQSIYNQAKTAASQPFQDYTGERAAGFNGDFKTATDAIKGLLSGDSGDMTSARSILDSLRKTVDPNAGVSSYMNPYIDAALNPTIRKIQEQGQRNRNQLGSEAAMAGAFGDSSYGIEKSLLARDETQAISDATSQAYSQGFDRATAARQAELARLFQISGAYQGLDKQATDKTTSSSQILAGLSDKERAVRQQADDAAYQEYLRKQKYPYEQAAFLSQILNATPVERGQTGTQTMSGTSTTTQPNTGGWDLLGKLIGTLAPIKIPGASA